MKKFCVRKALLVFVLLLAGVFVYHTNAHECSAFHSNGIITQPVKDIFLLFGQDKITTLKEANAFAQQHLLRSGERWDVQQETDIFKACKENQEKVLSCLQKLGMVSAIYPTETHFTYALCLGALASRFVQRLAFLATLQELGYSFDYIVLLGSARPLTAEEKTSLAITLETEAEMMRYLYDHHQTLRKDDLALIVIDAPMKQSKDGVLLRPTTDDTLREFKQQAPKKGSCLVISNNPYVLRQVKVCERILQNSEFEIVGAGEALDTEKVNIHILMDEFARTLYEEYTLYKA